ncbi:MAG TPA: hypothetical protein VFO10_04925 [Oligoflexus sp.]|nr:hypothetical protein [Oligoflexus sp.]HET9236567.1 hypothetical protein [Oligoflexus sp.]
MKKAEGGFTQGVSDDETNRQRLLVLSSEASRTVSRSQIRLNLMASSRT